MTLTDPSGATHQDVLDPHGRLVGTGLSAAEVVAVIDRTLAEDLAYGPDVTTETTIAADAVATASIASRADGVLAGVGVAALVLDRLAAERDVAVSVSVELPDGTVVRPGDDVVLTATGPTRLLLTAERTMLNLVSQLSGVATLTAHWVAAVDGTAARIRDTRKTVPGLRSLQKYAVRCGGGVNHRMGLGDAALIKDNHIAAAGSVDAAFRAVRSRAPQIPVEVECDTLDQTREAMAAGAELILLDNMTPDELRVAVALVRGTAVRLEASGGLTLADAAAVAATGVHFLAVGALTHSAPVLDLGVDLTPGRRPD